MKIEDDFLDIMRTEGGRRVMAYLINMSGFHSPKFTMDPTGATVMLAERANGARLARMLQEIDFDLYIKMLKEEHDNG